MEALMFGLNTIEWEVLGWLFVPFVTLGLCHLLGGIASFILKALWKLPFNTAET